MPRCQTAFEERVWERRGGPRRHRGEKVDLVVVVVELVVVMVVMVVVMVMVVVVVWW